MTGKLHQRTVLVDTNAIIEAHRTGTWRALAGGYRVATVEDCVTETQTGFQLRKPEQSIAVSQLRASLATEHRVDDRQRADWQYAHRGSYWTGVKNRCGRTHLGAKTGGFCAARTEPAYAAEYGLGFRDRIVSLEELLDDVGHRPRTALKRHYTKKWLEGVLVEILLAETSV